MFRPSLSRRGPNQRFEKVLWWIVSNNHRVIAPKVAGKGIQQKRFSAARAKNFCTRASETVGTLATFQVRMSPCRTSGGDSNLLRTGGVVRVRTALSRLRPLMLLAWQTEHWTGMSVLDLGLMISADSAWFGSTHPSFQTVEGVQEAAEELRHKFAGCRNRGALQGSSIGLIGCRRAQAHGSAPND